MSVHHIGIVETLHRSPEHVAACALSITVAVCFASNDETIGETISSLAAQTGTEPFELLLVSNGTTDDSLAVATRHSEGLPVRIVRCESVGYDANARNVAMAEAAGDKLLFVDADDTVGTGYVRAMADALERAPLVTSSWDAGPLAAGRRRPRSRQAPVTLLPFHNGGWPYAGSGTMGLRREVHETIGGYEPALRYAANNEWCFRAHAAGFEMVRVPDAFVSVRHRADLMGALRQRYRWGVWEVAAERVAGTYGLPRTTPRATARRWLLVTRAVLTPRDLGDLFAAALGLALAIGRLVGTLRFRGASDVHGLAGPAWRPPVAGQPELGPGPQER